MGKAATSVLFGFDFQVNAAIFIMLKNIKEMKSIRLEGEEDIDIELSDDSKILAQAKAVEKPYDDFSNVTTKLKEALASLSDTQKNHPNIRNLIYITNTPKPFGERVKSRNFESGVPTVLDYDELPGDLQKKVTRILKDNNLTLDTSKLTIQTLPFYSKRDEERYKFVYDEIKRFIYRIQRCKVPEDELHRIWVSEIFKNGTKREKELKLTKEDIIWPIVVMVIKNDDYSDFEIDVANEDVIAEMYAKTIRNCTERFEFVTKVTSSYSLFQCSGGEKLKFKEFITEKLPEFYEYFEEDSIDPEYRDSLLKIIIRNIVFEQKKIKDIKAAANL